MHGWIENVTNICKTLLVINLNYRRATCFQVGREGARHRQPTVDLAVIAKHKLFLPDYVLAGECATATHNKQTG